MSRVVLVSNRVLDLSKAARAGGVAVVLANIARTRKALWFGWNGEVKPAGEVDVIVLSTATPDRLLPSTAVDVQAALGATRAAIGSVIGCSSHSQV